MDAQGDRGGGVGDVAGGGGIERLFVYLQTWSRLIAHLPTG